MHGTWLLTGSEEAVVCLKDPAAPLGRPCVAGQVPAGQLPSFHVLTHRASDCFLVSLHVLACVGTQTAGCLWKGPWPVTGLRLSRFTPFKLALSLFGIHVLPSQSGFCRAARRPAQMWRATGFPVSPYPM